MMKKSFNIFNNLTLTQKITGGFSLFALLFILIVGISLYSSNNIRGVISDILYKVRPAVTLSAKLQETVEFTSASMGFYLLSKDEYHKAGYEKGLADLQRNIAELNQLPIIQEDPESVQMVAGIQEKVNAFAEFKERVLLYASSDTEKFPALSYTSANVSPLGQQLLQISTLMIFSEEGEDASQKRKKLMKELGDLRYATSSMMSGIRAYLASRAPSLVDEVNAFRDQVEQTIGRIKQFSSMLTLEQQEGIKNFESVFSVFSGTLQAAFAIHSSPQWRLDSYLISTEIAPLVNEILDDVEQLSDRQTERGNKASEEMFAEMSMINQLSIVVSVVALFAVAIIIFSIYQSGIKPIKSIVSALQDISEGEGDLTRRLQVNGKDEVGQLATAFNQFVSRIQELVSRSAKVSGSMSEGISQLEVVSKNLNNGAETQQNETQLVSRSIGELLDVSDVVTHSAQESTATVDNAKSVATHGQQTLTQAMDAFTSLEGQVVNASEVISQLEASSENIGGMLDVIKGIAEQTNLLALNAAIEAARAGEQGRGFAVVADEVRTLASRTQDSTLEIETLVTEFQSSAKDAAAAMASGKDKATEGVEYAQTVSAALDEIAQSIEAIAALSGKIAGEADSQKAISSEIQKNIGTLEAVGAQSAQGAHETRDTAQNLSVLRDDLQGLMKQFKV